MASELFDLIRQSNWKHAREYLDASKDLPLRDHLRESFALYIDIHELSERDQLKGSRTLREDRQRLKDLVESNNDYCGLNSLSYAEVSKAIYFIEDAGDRQGTFADGTARLVEALKSQTSDPVKALLLAKLGELHLANRDYKVALSFFDQALELESHPPLVARLNANRGNVHTSLGDFAKAAELYRSAEGQYPEGRRAVFYSNYGYLLMLGGQLAAAKQKVQQALQIDPEDWYSYLNLGLIQEELAEYADACESYRYVAENSKLLDPRREARILGGRCLEIAGRPDSDYLPMYLEADARSHTATETEKIRNSTHARAALYGRMADLLIQTNTHGTEKYIEWFQLRKEQLVKGS